MSTSLSDHFREMAQNNAWSNARLHRACAELTAEEFAAERVSFFLTQASARSRMSGRVPRRRGTRSRTHSSSLRKRRPTGMQHLLLGIDPVPMTIFEPVS
jgi:hypothetical protein